MNMTNLQRYEYFVLRYVPDLVKNEFVNFGVVLLDAERKPGDQGFAMVRFTDDFRRIKCMDTNADVEMLEALAAEMGRGLASARDREEMLHRIDQFSNTIQLSDSKFLESGSPQQEMPRLMVELVESHQEKMARAPHARGRMTMYVPMR